MLDNTCKAAGEGVQSPCQPPSTNNPNFQPLPQTTVILSDPALNVFFRSCVYRVVQSQSCALQSRTCLAVVNRTSPSSEVLLMFALLWLTSECRPAFRTLQLLSPRVVTTGNSHLISSGRYVVPALATVPLNASPAPHVVCSIEYCSSRRRRV